MAVTTSPASNSEVVYIQVNPKDHPVAYHRLVDELINMGRSADSFGPGGIRMELELIYEPGAGLFAVEPEAIEAGGLKSPYTGDDVVEDLT